MAVKLHTYNVYLDDFLIRECQRMTLCNQLQLTLESLIRLGFIPNPEKSCLVPSQDMVFVGMRLHTNKGVVCPTQDRVSKLLSTIASIWHRQVVTARQFLALFGLDDRYGSMGKTSSTPIQLYLLALWRPTRDALSRLIPVRPSLRFHLMWGGRRVEFTERDPITSGPSRKILVHRCFHHGLGVHLDSLHAAGVWSFPDRTHHIN